MSDTPIYDKLKYERDNPNWAVDGYFDLVLRMNPTIGMEKTIRISRGENEQDIQCDFAQRLHNTPRSKDYLLHEQYRRLYGRKAYKTALKTGTVVD